MTFEFKAAVSPNGQIALPSDVAGQIPAGEELHVVLTREASTDASASYLALGSKLQKAAAASAEDSVYDSFA